MSFCSSEITAILACSTVAQDVPQSDHFFVDKLEVVVDVTEKRPELLADVWIARPLQGVERPEQRVHGPVEVRGFPAQFVDPLRGRRRAAKDRRLDLFDVVLQAGDHRARNRRRSCPGWPTAPPPVPL